MAQAARNRAMTAQAMAAARATDQSESMANLGWDRFGAGRRRPPHTTPRRREQPQRFSSAGAAGAPRPQFLLGELAHQRARQAVAHLDFLGHFHLGDLLGQEGPQIIARHRFPGLERDEGLGRLPAIGIGHPMTTASATAGWRYNASSIIRG